MINFTGFFVYLSMSTIIEPFIDNLNAIERELVDVAKEVIILKKEEIISILQDSQLSLGLNSKNKVAGVYKTSTEQFASIFNTVKPKKAFEPYNFEWTGQTFAFMDVKNESGSLYSIFSTSGKQSILEKAYGELFDLTEENNDWINQNIILPELQKYILENIFR